MSLTIYTIPSLGEHLVKFNSFYEGERLILSPEEKIILKSEGERQCRFCGKKSSKDTTFRKAAHTIPNCLGNEYHVSDSECDSCNTTFGDFDDHLKRFFGAIPPMTGTKGRKGIRSYQSYNEGLTAAKSKRPFLEGDIEISIQESDGHFIEFDEEKGECTVRYTKREYIPFKVYKALLKIAISCLPDEEVKNYQRLINALVNNNYSELRHFAMVCETRISLINRYRYPLLFSFKKLNPTIKLHTHSFILCYQNEILQFTLPFHPDDNHIYEIGRASFCICPPLFFDDLGEISFSEPQLINLSSTEYKTDDTQQIKMSFPKSELDNKIVTTKNGEWYEGSSKGLGKIQGFILRRSNKPGLPLDPNKKIAPPE